MNKTTTQLLAPLCGLIALVLSAPAPASTTASATSSYQFTISTTASLTWYTGTYFGTSTHATGVSAHQTDWTSVSDNPPYEDTSGWDTRTDPFSLDASSAEAHASSNTLGQVGSGEIHTLSASSESTADNNQAFSTYAESQRYAIFSVNSNGTVAVTGTGSVATTGDDAVAQAWVELLLWDSGQWVSQGKVYAATPTSSYLYSTGQWGAVQFGVEAYSAVQDASLATVPLPPAVWLLGFALVGLAGARRRRGRAH